MQPGPILRAPTLRTPPGACDCHIHVFDPRFPLRPDRVFQPPEAPVDAYRAVQRRLGLDRVLIVQSSAYGTDHRCLVDAMAALDGQARGIAQVDAAVTDGELAALTAAGVRGARFLMVPGGVLAWPELERLAARLQDHGWHCNVQLDGLLIPEYEALLARLPGQVVLDHVGMFGQPIPPSHPAFQAVLRLLGSGRLWVKLSAPYAGGRTGAPPYPAVGALARILVREASDRMVWGSNWPHPFTTAVRGLPAEDDAMLLDLLLDWANDPAVRDQILADNPASLLGFPAVQVM